MTLQVLDPTNEPRRRSAAWHRARCRLRGKTVGFISNGKEGTKGFFAHLDRMLREEFGVADVDRRAEIQLQRAGRYAYHRRNRQLGRGCHWDWRLRQLFVVQSA